MMALNPMLHSSTDSPSSLLIFSTKNWCNLLLVLSILCNEKILAFSSTYSAKVFSANATNLLDCLLANYDKRIRPGIGGPPTKIIVNMNVRSMGPFSEIEESFAMQLYLRQVWYDSRLRFDRDAWGRSEFSLNWMFAGRIWKPDTFFINGKNSDLHEITAPNMFIRLGHDGQLMWSMRLTVRGTCLMHLRRFPLDTQWCPLKLASYGYNSRDVIYIWDPARDPDKLVTVDSDVSLAQYELAAISTSTETVITRHTEEISTLTVKFQLHRLTGFFLLQVYIPCILIVFSSWVAFWINKSNVPGRIGLGVTTVLSLTQLGFGNGPPVSYATAIDYFVILCFAFVFAAVLEYAFINFAERTTNKRGKKMEKFRLRIKEKIETAAREGRSLMPTLGKPVYKDTLHQLLKVALSLVPPANELALINPDEPDPGDMRAAFKGFLRISFVVIPGTSDFLQGDGEGEKTETTSIETVEDPCSPVSVKSGYVSPAKIPMLAVSLTSDDVKKEGLRTFELDLKHKESSPKKVGDDPLKMPLLSTAILERRRSRAPSIIELAEEIPPPCKYVEIWELLVQKAKLLTSMTPYFVLPREDEVLERFHMVDYYSRRIFPISFTISMTLYWYLYNYYITDQFPGEHKAPSDGLVVTSSL